MPGGPPETEARYHLRWFDALDDALAFARTKLRDTQVGDEELADVVRIHDHHSAIFVFSDRGRTPAT